MTITPNRVEVGLNEYQAWARAKFGTTPQCSALGLAGEAGEVVDLLKKHWHHGKALDRDALCKELGDVLWYVSDLASAFGLRLSDVAAANVRKLEARYPNGFTPADAAKRADETL